MSDMFCYDCQPDRYSHMIDVRNCSFTNFYVDGTIVRGVTHVSPRLDRLYHFLMQPNSQGYTSMVPCPNDHYSSRTLTAAQEEMKGVVTYKHIEAPEINPDFYHKHTFHVPTNT